MATVRNATNTPIGDKKGIYPSRSASGDVLGIADIDGVDVLVMDGLGIGIHNSASTDITISIIIAGDDSTNFVPVTVAGGTTWCGAFFNGIAIVGSTGHKESTTHYLYA